MAGEPGTGMKAPPIAVNLMLSVGRFPSRCVHTPSTRAVSVSLGLAVYRASNPAQHRCLVGVNSSFELSWKVGPSIAAEPESRAENGPVPYEIDCARVTTSPGLIEIDAAGGKIAGLIKGTGPFSRPKLPRSR